MEAHSPLNLSDEDRDLLIRTIIGEANGQPEVGQAAVAHVILNRAQDNRWGNTVKDVVLQKAQFEPWTTRRNELLSIPVDDPNYLRVATMVDNLGSDPTNGATHFLNEKIVRERRGGSLPSWAVKMSGSRHQIGDHTFLGGRGGVSNPAERFDLPEATFRSTRDDLQADREAEAEAPSFREGVGLAIGQEWVGSAMLRDLGNIPQFAPDPDFNLDAEIWKELTKDLPETYHDMFDGALSMAHAEAIREQALEIQENERRLGLMGGTGVALRIGAAITDPIGIGLTIATAGAGTSATAGRAVNALRAGAAAGAVNAGLEAGLANGNPNRTATDILIAGGLGLGLGGAIGFFTRTPLDAALEKPARSIAEEFGGESINAARVPGTEPAPVITTAEQRLLDAHDAPKSALGSVRVDMVGVLKQNEHPLIRKLAGELAEDGVGNADDSPLVFSATERVSRGMKLELSSFQREAKSALRDWRISRGLNWWQGRMQTDHFLEEVGRAVRRPSGTYTSDPSINRVADHLRKQQTKLLREAKFAGLKGFDEIAENDTYFMRVANHSRIDELVSRYGEGNIINLIRNAILSRSDDLDVEDVTKIAAGYLRTLRQSKFQDIDTHRIFNGDASEILEGMLKEATDLPQADIERISKAVRGAGGEAGKSNRAKRRLQVDETYATNMADGQRVAFEDLFDSNAERVFSSYSRQILGRINVQEALRTFTVKRPGAADIIDDTPPSFDTVAQNIRDTASQHGLTPSQLEDALTRLRTLHDAALGIPLNPRNKTSEALRMLRDYNFIRVMNQVGVAQLIEVGNILGQASFRATLQQVPALRSIFRRAKDGRMDDQLLDEIEVIWGMGTDRLRNSFTNRMDDYGVFEGRSLGKVDDLLQQGKAITADISLMAPVNQVLQRMAGRAAIQRFMNIATGSKPFTKRRLATMGLSPEDGEAIAAQMRKHVTAEEGILGRNVKRLNIDEWDDQEAASKFIDAVDKWTRRIIQENDIGQMSRWMTKDLGKTFIQFRSFMVGAWTKQTLNGIHNRDVNTFAAWATSILFGGLTYMGQIYLNSVGRSDQKEYLERRLSTEAVGASAFQRAGFASFVPAAVDQITVATGFDPVFAYGRSTGLASHGWVSNPTLDLGDKAFASVRGVIGSVANSDRTFSQQDARAIQALAPFQNAFGIRNAVNLITADLPRFSE